MRHIMKSLASICPSVCMHSYGRNFLRVKAECFARLSHRLGVCPSVRPSVRLSHSWSVSKRCKLGSRSFYCGLPQNL